MLGNHLDQISQRFEPRLLLPVLLPVPLPVLLPVPLLRLNYLLSDLNLGTLAALRPLAPGPV